MLPRAVPPSNLRQQVKSIGLRHCVLILSPDTPTPMHRALRLRAGVSLARIDLSLPQDQRRKALHPKWRNQLKHAEGAGLRIVHATLPAEPSHPLLMEEAQMAQSRRYNTWPPTLTAAFAQTAPQQTRLFTALKGNTPIAQMLFLRHGIAATYHIGKTTALGRTTNAHNLLLWHASNWLADHGHTQLELGTLDPQTPDLNRFKLRAGATPHLRNVVDPCALDHPCPNAHIMII